ncbi:uncharacterized protein N7515_003103 [Penicillium bovifimosum]|uniref:Uncharacterized protein n=1 Tax=Penicillium bovifimosum TaxID=126998 RepID=A0A9W9L5X1_9EURO|nr:uncharacterized protein N7515_003103 [Penicillium bovifimosum]KAJ5138255.1 hypothetical protein N7515_003103 [Penicillium bovifimosum]
MTVDPTLQNCRIGRCIIRKISSLDLDRASRGPNLRVLTGNGSETWGRLIRSWEVGIQNHNQ